MEEWKDIPGYEGYYKVSNLGRVKSLDRIIITKKGYNLPKKGSLMKPLFDKKNGYMRIRLSKGDCRMFGVHQLVAMAFLNHIPNGHSSHIDHIDCDKTNNILENIRIVTQRFNTSKERKGIVGVRGVFYRKDNDSYYSRISIKNQNFFLCSSKDIDYCKSFYEKAVELSHLFDGDRKKFKDKIKKEIE